MRRAASVAAFPQPGVGFVAWFEGGRWRAHEHAAEHGMAGWAGNTAFGTTQGRRELIDDFLDSAAMDHREDDDPREEARADDATIARVLDEGYLPSREALLAMMVFEECDLDAAAAAIRAFGDVTPVSLDEQAPTSQH